jgi:hypothetical protein
MDRTISKPGGKLNGEYLPTKSISICSSCSHRTTSDQVQFIRNDSKIGVGFLTTVFLDSGGVERWHETICPRLGDSSINVVGLVSIDQFRGSPARIGVPVASGKDAARRLAKACDVLIVWGVEKLQELLEDIEPSQKPKLIAVHHGDTRSPWANGIMLQHDPIVDQHVVVNEDVLSIKTTKPKVLIPNCVDPRAIEVQHGWQLPESLQGKKILLWSHRLSSEKRPFLLAGIIEALADRDPDWRLVVCGRGEWEGLRDHPLIYVAGVQHPGNWLSVADCFLSTADQEGFGLACAEAMLAGVPVVSPPLGICKEARRCLQVPVDAKADCYADAIEKSQSLTDGDLERISNDVKADYSLFWFLESWRMEVRSLAADKLSTGSDCSSDLIPR